MLLMQLNVRRSKAKDNMKRHLLLSVASIFISGCAAGGPIFVTPPSPSTGKAKIVIYRSQGLGGKAHVHRYFIDHTWVASLKTEGYTALDVDAGVPHLFGMDETLGEKNYFSITFSEGKTYYISDTMVINHLGSTGLGGGMYQISMKLSLLYAVTSIGTPPAEIQKYHFNPPYTKLPMEWF